MVTPPTCSHTQPENRKQKKNNENKHEENDGNAEVVSVFKMAYHIKTALEILKNYDFITLLLI